MKTLKIPKRIKVISVTHGYGGEMRRAFTIGAEYDVIDHLNAGGHLLLMLENDYLQRDCICYTCQRFVEVQAVE